MSTIQKLNNLSSNLKAFYWHKSAEYLLSIGWDMEQDPLEFLDATERTDIAFTIRAAPEGAEPYVVNVAERELVLAATGEDSRGLRELMFSYERAINSKADVHDSMTCDVSMHSGSSDYLHVRDVRDYCEKVRALTV